MVWATALIPAVGLFYVSPQSREWFGGELYKAVSAWFLFAIVYSIWLLFSFRPASSAAPAIGFLKELFTSKVEYCLLLRPFGSDGYIPLRTWYPPNSARATLLAGVPTSKTLERVLEASANKILKCGTIALVDPALKVIPKSPRYISSDNRTWQSAVDILLRRALVVVLILPPSQRVRESIRWELHRAIQLGLLGRLLFVLPPPGTEGHAAAHGSLQDLGDLLPALNKSESNWIVIYPKDSQGLKWFEVSSADVYDKTYDDAISQVFSEIIAQLAGLSFGQRYPYRSNTKVLEFRR